MITFLGNDIRKWYFFISIYLPRFPGCPISDCFPFPGNISRLSVVPLSLALRAEGQIRQTFVKWGRKLGWGGGGGGMIGVGMRGDMYFEATTILIGDS